LFNSFAWMSFVRMEPGSLLAAYGLTLGEVLLLGMTWAGEFGGSTP
jgi:hypothetical protein